MLKHVVLSSDKYYPQSLPKVQKEPRAPPFVEQLPEKGQGKFLIFK